jgi:hypothetical protein
MCHYRGGGRRRVEMHKAYRKAAVGCSETVNTGIGNSWLSRKKLKSLPRDQLILHDQKIMEIKN